MIVQTYDLDVTPNRVRPFVYVSQFDQARQIVFNMYDGDEEYNPASASVVIGEEEIEATVSGNTVTFNVPEDLTQVAQLYEGEVRTGDVMGSCNFRFKVDSTPI